MSDYVNWREEIWIVIHKICDFQMTQSKTSSTQTQTEHILTWAYWHWGGVKGKICKLIN